MFRLILRIILIRTPLKSLGFFTQTPSKSLRFLSSYSDIVSYPQSAKNKNHVILFFENHGFSKSQIFAIVNKLPHILSVKPEKSLLPKLLFFQSKGFSSPEVAKLVSGFPYILARSLNKRIIPSFDYFHEFLQSEDKTVAIIKGYVGLLYVDFRSCVRPNIEVLNQTGVPQNKIEALLRWQPRSFLFNPIRFKKSIEEVKVMGFNPLRYTFVVAVSALLSMSKSTWKKKVEVYRKWGCSEEDVLSAFARHPVCMLASKDKINGHMDYFVNKIGCKSSFITRYPALVCYSLNRRIIPRGSVYLVLSSKGLIKKDVNIRLFKLTEKGFLDKFIKPYEKHIPGLLKLYEEKLKVSECKEG